MRHFRRTKTASDARIGAEAQVAASKRVVQSFPKETKVSEFRQAWIDGLREDTAKFIGIWYYVASDIDLLTEQELASREFWRSAKDEFIQMEIMQAKIELRLNPKEHAETIEQLRYLASGESIAGLNHPRRVEEIRSFSDKIQAILKSEWSRVKKGEDTYRFIKTLSRITIFTVLLLAAAGWLVHVLTNPGAP